MLFPFANATEAAVVVVGVPVISAVAAHDAESLIEIAAPLALLQALSIQAERGILRSTAAQLRRELGAAGFAVTAARAEQALPVARVLLNPRLGWPQLGAQPAVTGALDALERLARRVIPRQLWLYLSFQAVRI